MKYKYLVEHKELKCLTGSCLALTKFTYDGPYNKLHDARLAAKRQSLKEGGERVRIYKAIETVEIMGHRSRV